MGGGGSYQKERGTCQSKRGMYLKDLNRTIIRVEGGTYQK